MFVLSAVVTVVVLLLTDALARSMVQGRIDSSLEHAVLSGSGRVVTVTAQIDAWSGLLALVTGQVGGVTLEVAIPVADLGAGRRVGALGGSSDADVTADGGLLIASTTLDLFGLQTPVSVELSPVVTDGALQLVPTAVRIAGTTVSADALGDREVLSSLAEPQPVDLGALPSGASLTGAEVVGDSLVLHARIEGDTARDLQGGASR